jgi:hypothetical protein
MEDGQRSIGLREGQGVPCISVRVASCVGLSPLRGVGGSASDEWRVMGMRVESDPYSSRVVRSSSDPPFNLRRFIPIQTPIIPA